MSLKAFHLFFIIVSTLFFGGFGIWAVYQFMQTREPVTLAMGIVSFAAGGAMIPYSRWFLHKLKDVGYL